MTTRPLTAQSADDDVEEGNTFAPHFDRDGLVPVIVADAADNRVLMFAFMNTQALDATLSTGLVHFWSRSRGKLWQKGETSGETLKVVSIMTDCDQDCLLITAQPQGRGATCHTGRRSCFYRSIDLGASGASGASARKLLKVDAERLFDPKQVYQK